jgi:hypothetical protein
MAELYLDNAHVLTTVFECKNTEGWLHSLNARIPVFRGDLSRTLPLGGV